MVASELNHQIVLLLKRPLTHYWSSPLIYQMIKNPINCDFFFFFNQTIEELEKEMLNGQKLQGPQTAFEVHQMLKSKNLLDR